MSHSTYSCWGTNLHLILEDEVADLYNAAVDGFLAAQKQFAKENGRLWTGQGPLPMTLSKEEMTAYNGIAEIINALAKVNGGSISIRQEDVTSDYLIKL